MDVDTPVPEQCDTVAVVFGLVSIVRCWCFPFRVMLGSVGAALGLFAWCAGPTAERALVGAALAASGRGLSTWLAWDDWHWVLSR